MGGTMSANNNLTRHWSVVKNQRTAPRQVYGSVQKSSSLCGPCPVTRRDPESLEWGADEDTVGQLSAGILCTTLRPPPSMGSKDQTETEGGAEAGAGRVMGSA